MKCDLSEEERKKIKEKLQESAENEYKRILKERNEIKIEQEKWRWLSDSVASKIVVWLQESLWDILQKALFQQKLVEELANRIMTMFWGQVGVNLTWLTREVAHALAVRLEKNINVTWVGIDTQKSKEE